MPCDFICNFDIAGQGLTGADEYQSVDRIGLFQSMQNVVLHTQGTYTGLSLQAAIQRDTRAGTSYVVSLREAMGWEEVVPNLPLARRAAIAGKVMRTWEWDLAVTPASQQPRKLAWMEVWARYLSK